MPIGEASAGIEETYREQRLTLLRLAFLLCGSVETSEDVVQSAFTSAQSRWYEIQNPRAYLRRSVINLVKDSQRRHFRVMASIRRVREDLIELPPEVDETWGLITQLPWTQRAVVVLHYYEDLQLIEIAHLLGRSESTVRSDHRRALDKLRKEMQ